MENLAKQLKTSIIATLIFAALFCGIYPVLVWGIGQAIFQQKANGSLVFDEKGNVVGSRLVGQNFTDSKYFHPRPSENGYDPRSSGGSNLGPTSKKLENDIKENIARYRAENDLPEDVKIPADAVTTSASGLDPHISRENAFFQEERVARARSLDVSQISDFVEKYTETRTFGFLGSEGVNVLLLNSALDKFENK